MQKRAKKSGVKAAKGKKQATAVTVRKSSKPAKTGRKAARKTAASAPVTGNLKKVEFTKGGKIAVTRSITSSKKGSYSERTDRRYYENTPARRERIMSEIEKSGATVKKVTYEVEKK